jgi:hypothetical protein
VFGAVALLDARGIAAVTAALAAVVDTANQTAPEQGNSLEDLSLCTRAPSG